MQCQFFFYYSAQLWPRNRAKIFFVKGYQTYEIGKTVWHIPRPKFAILRPHYNSQFFPCFVICFRHKTLGGLETCLNYVYTHISYRIQLFKLLDYSFSYENIKKYIYIYSLSVVFKEKLFLWLQESYSKSTAAATVGGNSRQMALWTSNKKSESTFQPQLGFCQLPFLF